MSQNEVEPNEILKEHIQRITSHRYVYLTYYRDDDVLYQMPFETCERKFNIVDKDSGTVELYNCITEKKETIDLLDIYGVRHVEPPEGEDFDVWSHDQIQKLKQYPGWNQDLRNDGLSDIPEDQKDSYRYKYFSCDEYACRVRPAVAFLLCKLELKCYEDLMSIDLDVLKHKWKGLICESKQKANEILTNERLQAEADGAIEDVEEIDVIMDLLLSIDDEVEIAIKDFKTINEVLSYWPPLLLPSPAYVQIADL